MKNLFSCSPFLLLMALLTSGCGFGDAYETRIVPNYSDAPWQIHSKTNPHTDRDDYNMISGLMSGIDNIDQFIALTTFPLRAGTTCRTYDKDTDVYQQLSEKHKDQKNPPFQLSSITQYLPSYPFSILDFVSLEVYADEDFDAAHPAGSSLLDLLHYATTTPYRILNNNYQAYFNTDALFKEQVQLFNTYKLGTSVTASDMTIVNFMFLSFDKLPDPLAPKHIRIRLTADDGTRYDFETLLSFQTLN